MSLSRLLVQRQPDDPRSWTLEGIVLSGMKRNQESLKAFQGALHLKPDYVPALEGAAQIEYNNHHRESAEALLNRLVRLRPEDQTAHAMLGVISFESKDCSGAITHFGKSSAVIRNNPTALTEFGGCLLHLHRASEAVPVFDRISALQLDDWHSRYNLAVAEFEANEFAVAVQTLQPFLDNPHANPYALNLAAACYEEQNETAQAVGALRRAILIAPDDVRNYLDLAGISLDHGSFQVGVDVLDAGLHRLPNSWKLHATRGVLYVQLGKFEEANTDFEIANRLQPAQQMANVAMGIALVQENRLDQSLDFVRSRLRQTPNDAALNYLLAEILIRKGIRPGSQEFPEAVEAAKRATKAKPEFVLARDDLAQLELMAGHLNTVIHESQESLKADPSDQTAIYHLILAYRRMHRTAEAAVQVKRLAVLSSAALKRYEQRNRVRLVVNDLPTESDGLK